MYKFGWGGWTFDYDNTAYLLYHSGEHWNPYIKDATLDAMLEEQRTMIDRDAREKKLHRHRAATSPTTCSTCRCTT